MITTCVWRAVVLVDGIVESVIEVAPSDLGERGSRDRDRGKASSHDVREVFLERIEPGLHTVQVQVVQGCTGQVAAESPSARFTLQSIAECPERGSPEGKSSAVEAFVDACGLDEAKCLRYDALGGYLAVIGEAEAGAGPLAGLGARYVTLLAAFASGDVGAAMGQKELAWLLRQSSIRAVPRDVGWTLAHLRLLSMVTACLDAEDRSWVLVLGQSVTVPAHFVDELTCRLDSVAAVDAEWDVVCLALRREWATGGLFQLEVAPGIARIQSLRHCHSQGYLIRRSAAAKLLDRAAAEGVTCGAGCLLQHPSLSAYAFVRPLVATPPAAALGT